MDCGLDTVNYLGPHKMPLQIGLYKLNLYGHRRVRISGLQGVGPFYGRVVSSSFSSFATWDGHRGVCVPGPGPVVGGWDIR